MYYDTCFRWVKPEISAQIFCISNGNGPVRSFYTYILTSWPWFSSKPSSRRGLRYPDHEKNTYIEKTAFRYLDRLLPICATLYITWYILYVWLLYILFRNTRYFEFKWVQLKNNCNNNWIIIEKIMLAFEIFSRALYTWFWMFYSTVLNRWTAIVVIFDQWSK